MTWSAVNDAENNCLMYSDIVVVVAAVVHSLAVYEACMVERNEHSMDFARMMLVAKAVVGSLDY